MPDWKGLVRGRIGALGLPAAAEADLAEELAQHLEDRYAELRSGGASEEEAERGAMAELEGRMREREWRRPHRSLAVAAPMDFRFAARMMRRNPGFVLFVVLTLGLGIGANTTVFTVINTLLLHPLPVPRPAELAVVTTAQSTRTTRSYAVLPVSLQNLKDYQSENRVFQSLAAYSAVRVVTLQDGSRPERLFAELVTGNYFDALGLQPAAGRFFLPEEDGAPGAHAVAILNYATWQGRFGGAADVVGRKLVINKMAFTVIGVAPRNFIGLNAIFGPDLWIPAAMAEQLLPSEMRGALEERTTAAFLGVGRLKPGISRAKAQANIAAIAAALEREYPDANEGRTAAVRPISDVLFGSTGSGTAPVLMGSVVLLIVVGMVLLIACSNVANLLLARSAARRQEMAVRLAIGAGRGQLVRQLLTESVALGALSGLAGLAIGYAGVRALWSALPAAGNFIEPKLDAVVFAFTLVVALATGFAFGIIPALRASRLELGPALNEEARTIGKSRRRMHFGNVLLAGQVAFSFVLLMLAALFLRSIARAYEIDPGFQTRHLAVFLTNPGQVRYGQARAEAFYKDVRERVAALPGIASASWASSLPLWGRVVSGLEVEGHEQRSKADVITTVLDTVDVGYFETAGVAIDRGREFNEMDRADSRPVAIVNEKLAHDYWPDQDAIGKLIRLPNEKAMREIVGIARTANYTTLAEPPQACVYVPLAQNYSDANILYVRSKGNPQEVLIPVQREIQAVGPGILATDMRTGRTIIENGLFQAKVGVMLLSVFGLLALGLASVGLYGVMAYSVSQRKREIGVRMALGAGRSSVLGLVLKEGMTVVAAGAAIGLGGGLVAGRLLARVLYGVSASDPLSIAGAGAVLMAVALAACYLPARRASRLDPLAALREQ